MKNKPCKHRKQLGHCRVCRPKKYCKHKVHRSHCRVCYPIGWANGILSVARGAARRRNYVAPDISPLDLIALKNTKKCILCGATLNWTKKSPHLHHNHKSGVVYGFAHQLCNQAEGMLMKLASKQLRHFIIALLRKSPAFRVIG